MFECKYQLGITAQIKNNNMFTVQIRFLSEFAGMFSKNKQRKKSINTPKEPLCPGFWSRKNKGEGQTEKDRQNKETQASVPLRVPRPELIVGKVTKWFSHDPREEAFFLLGPWMEKRCHWKPTKGALATYSKSHSWHHVSLYICHLTAISMFSVKNSSITSTHFQVTWHRPSCVTLLSLSHSLSHIETKNKNVCMDLKIVVTQWMWGTSCKSSNLQWLDWAWSLQVNAALKNAASTAVLHMLQSHH